MSGGKPRPRNESVDSAMIAAATSIVAATITGPSAFGRMWRTTWRALLAPSARAASTNSFSRSERNCARTSRATGIQRKPPMTITIMMNTPPSTPNGGFEGIAEQVDHQQQQRQRRQRQEQVGEPHQRRADPAARHAGGGADRRADDHRDHHGGEADRERDAPAVEHACEQVLPEIVGAERMRPRRRLHARGEIDVVDRDAPDERRRTRSRRSSGSRMMALANASRWRRKRRQASQPRRERPQLARGCGDLSRG